MEKGYKLGRRDFLKAGLIGASALAMGSVGCNPNHNYEEKAVIFRMDDLQGWWLEEEANKLVNIHIENNIPITLGVVSGCLHERVGEPNSITENLKKWNRDNKNLVEIASHSHNHENYETWSLDKQVEDIKKSKEELNNLGINPVTFIPPYNWGNEYTPQAINDAGFKIGVGTPENPYIDSIKNPMILEGGIEFKSNFKDFNFSDWDAWDVSDFIDSDEKPYMVVAYHQQDFDGASENEFKKFGEFLKEMKNMGKYSFMTAKQYHNKVLGQ